MSVLPPPIPQPPYSAAPSPIVMMSTTDSEHQTSLPSTPFPYKNRSSTKSTTHRRSRSAQQYQRHQSLPLGQQALGINAPQPPRRSSARSSGHLYNSGNSSESRQPRHRRPSSNQQQQQVHGGSQQQPSVPGGPPLQQPQPRPMPRMLYPINSYMPSLQQQMMWYQSALNNNNSSRQQQRQPISKKAMQQNLRWWKAYMTAAQQSMTSQGGNKPPRRHGSHGRPRRRMSGALAQFHQRQSSSSRRRRTEFNGDRPVMSYSSSQHPPSRLSHVTHASSRSDSSPSGDNHHPITTTQSPENNNSSPEHAPDCCLDNPTTSTDSLLHPSQTPNPNLSENEVDQLLDDAFADLGLHSFHPSDSSDSEYDDADDECEEEEEDWDAIDYCTPPLCQWEYPEDSYEQDRETFYNLGGTHLNTSFIGQEFPVDFWAPAPIGGETPTTTTTTISS
ncbi:hypothetical protein DFS34DRAFT_611887 [Phlyctochytrium arcticum]|nr:hypothetical protein DFS34DRAFT_611887 [Phlyctochytrium arcticum]